MAMRDRHRDGVEGGGGGDDLRLDDLTPELVGDQSDQDEERELTAELAGARAEAAEHYDRLLRAQAELQNVLKRHERDRADRARYASEALARDLLPVVDDLQRALQHAADRSGGLAQGVEMVNKSLLGVLGRHGIERIEAYGQPFDPTLHEAVAAVETDDVPENTVVEEHRAGYRLYDRLLRPAMVAVSKAPQRRE
jgi:molecular chaperone GrpE